ncbi:MULTISPECIES: hypothetical protein [Photorhabdus]|uniref:hypothetical protein n=1 Tax=Photorhabdus TaxID=29487 RepID=UPI0002D7C1A8|nr:MULTISPECIES: hypothetical protein [Photorhabdus]AWK41801.1 hypothetical protein A4R40_10025 [Photorhabdus laumondii subsp. laumondii]MCC8384884.1 hypothetical protein [Photorhabdus laumondii]MCC8388130.1 hypothetical protein [Photorhabdus laumondii]
MKKNYAISPQFINTIEKCNEPWGIKDSSSNFIYGNSAKKDLLVTLSNHLIIKNFMIMNHPRILGSRELN